MSAHPSLIKASAFTVAVSVAVLLCVALLDRPLALALHGLRGQVWLDWLTQIPVGLGIGAVLVLLGTPWRLALAPPPRPAERVLLAMSVSLACAVLVKDLLKVVFGRAWPETWVQHNPSLIHDQVYGFFWMRASPGFHSFPSGHATVTFAALSVLWLAAARLTARRRLALRALAALGCALVIVGLLGMNFHFLGDIVAGAALGSASGIYAWACIGRQPELQP